MCDQESEIRNGKSGIQNPKSKIASISGQPLFIRGQPPFIPGQSALISGQTAPIAGQVAVILGFIIGKFVVQTPRLYPNMAPISVIYPPISRHFAIILRSYKNGGEKIAEWIKGSSCSCHCHGDSAVPEVLPASQPCREISWPDLRPGIASCRAGCERLRSSFVSFEFRVSGFEFRV
jgi:hypothetical protein